MCVRRLLAALVVAAASLAGVAGAVLLGNFAASGWLPLVLTVPCTIGLPTMLTAAGIVALWPGGALAALFGTCLVLGALAQLGAGALWRRLRSCR